MSDREAFVSAIAANPADDLPRLVFADWLDEHGDPERAEFIRTQIRWRYASDDAEKTHLDRRAGELLREHWMRWFAPLLLALDPFADLARRYRYAGNIHPAMLAEIAPVFALRDKTPVTHAYVSHGFLSLLGVDVSHWANGASLAEAFRYEPVRVLQCRDGLHSPRWQRFTEPVLRRVEHLTMYQQWAWQASAPESTALLEDLHLAGVRQFSLLSEGRERWELTPLPVAWLERFVRSPLAYRLTGLYLPCISPDGVVPLCRPGRLHLERLELGGELNAEGVRRLGGSELAGTVRELKLNKARLGNTGVAALARDPWRKLTHLELKENDLSTAVLPALTAAEFLPRLKVLDLSGNLLFMPLDPDSTRLGQLADALDPERLEHLDLSDTGLSAVPDFLAERFGDRVTI
jgi:uncharacterized protein (TIGR02996 family)